MYNEKYKKAKVLKNTINLISKPINANKAYSALAVKYSQLPKIQFPGTMPAGAGNKGATYLNEPTDPLKVGNDGTLEFN